MRFLITAALILLPIAAPAQNTPPGFTNYTLGLMTRAAGQLPPGTTQPELQKAHLANLNKMWEEGLLLASGPIGDKGDLRGVLILRGDADTIRKRIADDPLVKAGFLAIALKPWMGPIGIGDEYKKWAAANPGQPDKMRAYQLVLFKGTPGASPMTPDQQRAHLMALDAQAKSGKLVAAGPLLEPDAIIGIGVYSVDAAEADALAANDPAVKSGKMAPQRHPWFAAEGVLPTSFKVPVP